MEDWRLKLKEKIGQLIIAHLDGDIRFESKEYYQALKLIEDYSIGGFIIFGGDCSHTPHLIETFKKYSPYPLLFASDMENGVGQQLKGGIEFPSCMALGATQSEKLAFETGKAIALEAKTYGINMLLAPVLDVNTQPRNPIINTRSYSDRVELVSLLGTSFIKGVQEAGIIATAKHFPGHGHTITDSHLMLPVLNLDKDLLYQTALPPFISAIKQGVKAIMIAHLYVPAFEGNNKIPASISSTIINNLLMNELGFKGIIVTDSLRMKGLIDFLCEEEASLFALKAGVDILLHPADPAKLINFLSSQSEKDTHLAKRIENSFEKICELKKNLNKSTTSFNFLSTESLKLSHLIARLSVTLLKEKKKLIPLPPDSSPALLLIQNNTSAAIGEVFSKEFQKRYKNAKIFFFPAKWNGKIDDISSYSHIICAIFSRVRASQNIFSISPSLTKYLHHLIENGRDLIMIYLGNPYIYHNFSEASLSLSTFSDSEVSQKAAVEIIAGEIPLCGKLPIKL